MNKSCYDKALELLARRGHSRFELKRKLSGRKFSLEEVEAALDRVSELGYLDDAQFARDFIRQRLGRGPVGARRLQAELAKRGVAAEDAAPALTELLPADDRDAARQAARGWQRRRSKVDRAALGRYLARQGFSRRAIFAVLDEVGEGAELEDEIEE